MTEKQHDHNQTHEENDQPEETLAERSARLEAEAAATAENSAESNPYSSSQTAHDPLAPEPIQESTEEQHTEVTHSIGDQQSQEIIIALQDQLDAMKDQATRALAEAENTRRRAKKDREDAGKYAITGFAKSLLEVSDNLRRAVEAFPEDLIETDPRIGSFIDGIEATERSLLKVFEQQGIQKIEPLDEPFNPNFHEVMFEAPVPGKSAGLVIQVLEPGYVIKDRLLRPARVGISKGDSSSPQEPPAGGKIDTQA